MSEKEKLREPRSMLMVYTGNGKGKSTAAFGAVFRAMGWGDRVAVVQFIKGKWTTGEQQFAETLPGLVFEVMGRGFTWESEDISRDARAAEKAWGAARDFISSGTFNLVVLDELTYCFHHGFLDLEQVLPDLINRPQLTSVIVTGRHAPEALVEHADLVTEMKLVKHPFQSSGEAFRALKGVDY